MVDPNNGFYNLNNVINKKIFYSTENRFYIFSCFRRHWLLLILLPYLWEELSGWEITWSWSLEHCSPAVSTGSVWPLFVISEQSSLEQLRSPVCQVTAEAGSYTGRVWGPRGEKPAFRERERGRNQSVSSHLRLSFRDVEMRKRGCSGWVHTFGVKTDLGEQNGI